MERLQNPSLIVRQTTVKKKPIINSTLTAFLLFIHILLAFANFGLEAAVKGVQQQVDQIGYLIVTMSLPLVMALIIAPLIAAGRNTAFSREFMNMLFTFVCLNLVVNLFRMTNGLL